MRYESKSVAHWARVLAAALALGGVVLAAVSGTKEPALGLAGVLLILLAVVVTNFSVLTLRVDGGEVVWAFGPGWPGRRLSLEGVRAVESRRAPWFWGWGIRWTPRGWLWRAHGLDAVWLEREGGKWTGIGTQDPEGAIAAIEAGIKERAEGQASG